MSEELRAVLEAVAERGSPAGAAAVVERAVAQAGGGARRRWGGRQVLMGAAAAALALVVLAAGSLVYMRHKLGSMERVSLRASLSEPGDGAGPVNVLVVGTDSDRRADAIVLVTVDPSNRQDATVTVLSAPRDLWDPVARSRLADEYIEGPAPLIESVRRLLDVRVDHYVQVDGAGFKALVDAAGGVALPFDAPARDAVSGFSVPAPGCPRLDGQAALALARSRHLESLRNGQWTPDPTGDLGRMHRQRDLFGRLLTAVLAERSPAGLKRLLDSAARHVVMDDGFSTGKVLDLADRLRQAEKLRVESRALAVRTATVDGAVVLELDPAQSPTGVADAPPPAC
jgi:LCP family protein required for cell wall assembly